jgi:hypothetical protein
MGLQNPVLSFNGRGGVVTLTGADVAAVNLFPTALPPGAPIAGQMWFNTATHVLSIYDGAVWRVVTLT